MQAAGRTALQKEEPPDLLAGLASQAGSADDDDVPDWLASLNPGAKAKPPAPSAPSEGDTSGSDFLTQLNQKESKPEPISAIPQDDAPAWMSGLREEATIPFEKDELLYCVLGNGDSNPVDRIIDGVDAVDGDHVSAHLLPVNV